jgi:hypothetical protein
MTQTPVSSRRHHLVPRSLVSPDRTKMDWPETLSQKAAERPAAGCVIPNISKIWRLW